VVQVFLAPIAAWVLFADLVLVHSKSIGCACNSNRGLSRCVDNHGTDQTPSPFGCLSDGLTSLRSRRSRQTELAGIGSRFRWYQKLSTPSQYSPRTQAMPSKPSPCAEMALPLFCQGLLNHFGLEPLIGVHLLQASILVL